MDKITDITLDYYNRHAEDFWEGTRNHDVSQNILLICFLISENGVDYLYLEDSSYDAASNFVIA